MFLVKGGLDPDLGLDFSEELFEFEVEVFSSLIEDNSEEELSPSVSSSEFCFSRV